MHSMHTYSYLLSPLNPVCCVDSWCSLSHKTKSYAVAIYFKILNSCTVQLIATHMFPLLRLNFSYILALSFCYTDKLMVSYCINKVISFSLTKFNLSRPHLQDFPMGTCPQTPLDSDAECASHTSCFY